MRGRLLEAPSSINWATPASTVVFAGRQLQWTTQTDLHMAAAYTVASVSANATGLFTHDGGIQAVAANGPVSLQAHNDQLEILADNSITVVSVNDAIKIEAHEKIVVQAGQSSVTLEGGNITFACPGNFTVKGRQHIFEGGINSPVSLQPLPLPAELPKEPISARVIIDRQLQDVIAGAAGMSLPYRFLDNSGSLIAQATLDSHGATERIFPNSLTDYKLLLGETGEWKKIEHDDTDDGVCGCDHTAEHGQDEKNDYANEDRLQVHEQQESSYYTAQYDEFDETPGDIVTPIANDESFARYLLDQLVFTDKDILQAIKEGEV
jgi:type VI secretion system secreted protein VgrG